MEASTTSLESYREQVDEEHARFAEEQDAALEPVPDGGSLGERIAREESEPEPEPVGDLRVDGTTQLGLFEAGGKAAKTAKLKLKLGAVNVVDGKAYKKGDRLHFQGVAVVRELAQKDVVDKATGIPTACVQSHVAEVTDLVVEPAGVDGEAA